MRNGFGNKQNLDSFTPSREMLITRGPDFRQKTILMQNIILNMTQLTIQKYRIPTSPIIKNIDRQSSVYKMRNIEFGLSFVFKNRMYCVRTKYF